jgi:hypothetical protein
MAPVEGVTSGFSLFLLFVLASSVILLRRPIAPA